MDNAYRVVDTLFEVDDSFVSVCKALFGDDVSAEEVYEYVYTADGMEEIGKFALPSLGAIKNTASAAFKSPKFAMGAAKDGLTNSKPGKWVANNPLKATAIGGGVGAGAAGGAALVNKDKTPTFNMSSSSGNTFMKSDDVESVRWEGTFSKMDEDKRQVFGWASVVEVNGEPVVDRQGDIITPDEMEKAAYEYVLRSRKGGDMHRRNGEEPHHVSDMIESMVLTPEKIAKMGLPESTPVGWWVGFKVNDDHTWGLVKKGQRTGFSIHGRGKRIPVQ